MDFNCIDRNIQYLCYLFIFHVMEIAHYKHLSALIGQFANSHIYFIVEL